MAKTDAQIVKDVLDRMGCESNEAKAHEITRVLGKRVRQRSRGRADAGKPAGRAGKRDGVELPGPRYSPVPIQGEPLSATILRDRGAR